jgi:CRISPR-associated protein Cas1
MSSLYITEEYAVLKKKLQRLVIEKDGKVLLEVPSFKIDRIMLFGKIQVTADAIEYLLDNDIEVAFFNQYGRLKGRIIDVSSKNVYLRIMQYESYNNSSKRLKIAKSIVHGKIRNIITFLQRWKRNHPQFNFDKEVETLDNCLRLLELKTTISGVMGVEGIASSIYFRVFPNFILNDDWNGVFSKRDRCPPKDPINSLLSLGYSLVTNEIWSILEGIGFDAYIGFLHEIDYGRPSMAIDLVEEFRIPVVDRVVIELINHKVINKEDFEYTENGCIMKEDSLKKFFKHFDNRLMSNFNNYETKEETNYRKMFYYQAQKIAKAIMKDVDYKPFNYL